MHGIDISNGKALTGDAHLQQSVTDILTTPINSRVMRREYGFDFSVLAAPQNNTTLMRVYIAVVQSLSRWEPRIRITRVHAERNANGQLVVDLIGVKDTGEAVNLQSALG